MERRRSIYRREARGYRYNRSANVDIIGLKASRERLSYKMKRFWRQATAAAELLWIEQ